MPRKDDHKPTKKRQRTVVPPPPLPLIQLLQSDATVLQYFQALQQSLEDDVNVWKQRCLALQKGALKANPKKNISKRTNEKAHSPPSPVKEKRVGAGQAPKPTTTTTETAEISSIRKHETPVFMETMDIDDAMFEDDMSSDDSEEEEEDATDHHHPDDAGNLFLLQDDESDDDDDDHHRESKQQQTGQSQDGEDAHPDDLYDYDPAQARDQHIFHWLEQAYQGLERLRIPLIEYPSEATTEEPTELVTKESMMGI